MRIRDDNAVLHVVSADFGQSTRGCARIGEELRHDGELAVRVYSVAGPVECLVAHAVGIEVAAIRIASAGVAVRGVRAAACVAGAHGLCDCVARVRRVGCRHGVGFPDVHFGAAGTVVAEASVGVVGGRNPAVAVSLGGGVSALWDF